MSPKAVKRAAARFQPDLSRSAALFEAFRAPFEAAMKRARKGEHSVSLGIVDLDWFNRLNADHGVPVGDAVLQHLANRMQSVFSDHVVLRYGGDAMAVILENVEKEDAFLQLEQMRASLDTPHVVGESGKAVELRFTVSAGVAAYPDDGSQTVDVARKASEALYRAKVSGRNKVCLAREEKMVTKTVHYTQGQLHGLSRLAKRMGQSEAVLLREAVDDLLRKYNA